MAPKGKKREMIREKGALRIVIRISMSPRSSGEVSEGHRVRTRHDRISVRKMTPVAVGRRDGIVAGKLCETEE